MNDSNETTSLLPLETGEGEALKKLGSIEAHKKQGAESTDKGFVHEAIITGVVIEGLAVTLGKRPDELLELEGKIRSMVGLVLNDAQLNAQLMARFATPPSPDPLNEAKVAEFRAVLDSVSRSKQPPELSATEDISSNLKPAEDLKPGATTDSTTDDVEGLFPDRETSALPDSVLQELAALVASSSPEELESYKAQARRALGGQSEALIQEIERLAGTAQVAGMGLSEDFGELVLQAAGQLRKARDPEFALRFCTTQLAPAVQRLEDQAATAEQLVDLMINLFASEPVFRNRQFGPRTPPASWQFAEVLNRLLTMLWPGYPDTARRFDVDELQTLTNLMTWMGSGRQAKRLERIAWGCELALKMLASMLEVQHSPRLHRITFQVCNNLAGWLGDLAKDEESESQRTDLQRRLNALHTLATTADLKTGLSSNWEARATPLLGALGIDPPSVKRPHGVAKALLFMSRIPTAWRALCPLYDDLIEAHPQMAGDDPTSLRTAVLTLMSAVFRAEFNTPAEADEVTSALFNLGVDTLRFERNATDVEHANPVRLLTNALGLWWALDQARRQGLDLRQALDALNGASCAVNLFGALSDNRRTSLDASIHAPLRSLAAEITTAFENLNLNNELTRLTSSTRSMFGDAAEVVPRGRVPSSSRMQEMLEDVLRGLVATEGLEISIKGLHDSKPEGQDDQKSWTVLLPNKFSVITASLLGHAMRQMRSASIGDMEAHIQSLSEGWIHVVDRVLALADSPSYEMFQAEGLIPSDINDWHLDLPKIPRLLNPKIFAQTEAHTLSATLKDESLMRGFFGLLQPAQMTWTPPAPA